MEYTNQEPSVSQANLWGKILSIKEIWTFLMAPKLFGKSGKEHDFDFGFYLEDDGYLALGKLYSRDIRNGLSLLTYFNAQCNDVGADRKVIFSEREIPEEVELLANTLKIDILKNVHEVVNFLSKSLKEDGIESNNELHQSSIFSLKKDSKGDKSRKKYRDRTKLIHEVLNSASTEEGTTLNNLVIKCNLNYNSAKRIVDDLIKRELLSITKDGSDKTLYKTTGNGSQIIEKLRFINRVGHNEQ